jgi:hypothetical protein
VNTNTKPEKSTMSKALRKLIKANPELAREYRRFIVKTVLDLQAYQAQNATAKV